ncbi:cyclic nucleotide-gated cation channel alpha-3-like isoform X2 [Lineus longissimus]|uniref:cyclic nucleotide-gated cation channel alpha-3-like isoform X2 n=1 Tax=Lineus longissimus TaxID=88925 RepID=UPI002B4E453D
MVFLHTQESDLPRIGIVTSMDGVIEGVDCSGNGSRLASRRGHSIPPVQPPSAISPPYSPIPSPSIRSVSSTKSTWSELLGLKKRDSSGSFLSGSGSLSLSGVSSVMSEKLKELHRKFTCRTQYFKEKTRQTPTPSSPSCEADKFTGAPNGSPSISPGPKRHSSFSGSSSINALDDDIHYVGINNCKVKCPAWIEKFTFPRAIDPQSKLYIGWLFIVVLAFMYNAWVIPLRFAFKELVQKPEHIRYWLLCDYIADFIYVLDIVLFESRLVFIRDGIFVHDPQAMRQNYFKKFTFKIDLLSLMPLDLLYLMPSINYTSLVRIPRLFKIPTFWEFYERFDQAAKSGHAIRILKTMTYMIYLIHVEACGYFWISSYEKFSTNWTYSPEKFLKVTAYVRCFYIATKTATSIGKNPIPTNDLEYMFMTVYWLSGVFVFALLIGQIRDIFEAAGAVKSNYRKTMDITLWYMQSLNLPKELQGRVRMWFNYNWDQQKTLDENSLIEALPNKMKTDLAINVHFGTLSKVMLFQDCDKNLLYDLILKLKPVLYLPGDYICRKGEVGTEMYIVMSGQVQVVGGLNDDIIYATLHEGSVFGEISLLSMVGGNRRTADVRSKGFSNLFTLSKVDFEEAMRDYPTAQAMLKKRAKKLLSENKKIEQQELFKAQSEEIIKSRTPTPKMVHTVIKILEPDSKIAEILRARGKKKKAARANKVNPLAKKMEFHDENHLNLMQSLMSDDCSDSSEDAEEEADDSSVFESNIHREMDNLSVSLPRGLCCSDEDSTPVSEDNHHLERNEGKENSPPLEEASKEDKNHPTSKHNKEFINKDIAHLVIEREKQSLALPIHNRARPRRASNPRDFTGEPHSSSRTRRASNPNDLILEPHSPCRLRRASNPRDLTLVPRSPCRPFCYPLSLEVAPALLITEPKLEKSHPRIPDENMVTCNVEVHCEKSPENPDGVDNLAFIGSDSSHSIKNTLPSVPCIEKSISENG